MDRVLHFVLALAVVAILALLVSSDRKKNSYPLCYSTACYRSVTGVVLPELRRWFGLRERLLRNV
ncbi:nucleoside permease nupC [Escherichia coli]|nr:nucleoside permease nupC [Escherichia coli]SQY13361.1 nucleoside permease nupC [Escherichia coli]